jgi:hypothetical protein
MNRLLILAFSGALGIAVPLYAQTSGESGSMGTSHRGGSMGTGSTSVALPGRRAEPPIIPRLAARSRAA